jgi:hypothetical protein
MRGWFGVGMVVLEGAHRERLALQQLDTLGDRMMYRLAYRNFGDHEALVVNHTVTSGSSNAPRWYEIRTPNNTPTILINNSSVVLRPIKCDNGIIYVIDSVLLPQYK